MRRLAGIALLLLQLGSVAHARFVSSRWLAWAPNDYTTWYKLEVSVNGRPLSAPEIEKRYQLPAEYVYQNAVQNVMDIVRQYEQTYGCKEHARVVLVYRVNGKQTQEWRWPAE